MIEKIMWTFAAIFLLMLITLGGINFFLGKTALKALSDLASIAAIFVFAIYFIEVIKIIKGKI